MNKSFKLILLTSLLAVGLGSCSGGSSTTTSTTTSYYYTTSSYYRTSSSSISDKQKIINHIKGVGSYSNDWYMVETSSGVGLGYSPSSDTFGISYANESDNVIGMYVGVLSYGATTVYGGQTIYVQGSKVFDVNYSTYISNHKFSEINTDSLDVKYTASRETNFLEACVNVMMVCTSNAIDGVSSYLSSRGLPYLF